MEHLLEHLSYEERMRKLELFSLEKVDVHQLPDCLFHSIFPLSRVKMQAPALTSIQKILCSCQVTAGLSVLLRMRFPPSDS